MANKKVKYVEPVGYFSKETRKMFGLGEFAKDEQKADTKKTAKKETKKETKKTK